MDHQEIIKLFGKPLSEIAKPKTLNQIRFECFCIGALTVFVFGYIWLQRMEDRKRELANENQSQ